MSNPSTEAFDEIVAAIAFLSDSKPRCVGIVFRSDIQRALYVVTQRVSIAEVPSVPDSFGGMPTFVDYQQREEFLEFYDDELLRRYLQRNDSSEAMVRYIACALNHKFSGKTYTQDR